MATDTNLFSKSLNDQVKYLWLLYKRLLETPPGSSSWGSISGTLSDQTDLQSALDAKADVGSGGWGNSDIVVTLTGVSTLDQDSYTFGFINGNVGIRTASPTSTLDVHGTLLAGGSAAYFYTDASSNIYIGDPYGNSNGNSISISDSTNSIFFDNTGHNTKVGINTAGVAGVALSIVGKIRTNDVLQVGGSFEIQKISGTDPIFLGTVLAGDSASVIKLDSDIGVTTIGDSQDVLNATKVIINDPNQTVQINAAEGVSTSAGLTVGGGVKVTTNAVKNADYVITSNDFRIKIDAGGNPVTIDAANMVTGQIVIITAGNVSNTATVTGISPGDFVFAAAGDSIVLYHDDNDPSIVSAYIQ